MILALAYTGLRRRRLLEVVWMLRIDRQQLSWAVKMDSGLHPRQELRRICSRRKLRRGHRRLSDTHNGLEFETLKSTFVRFLICSVGLPLCLYTRIVFSLVCGNSSGSGTASSILPIAPNLLLQVQIESRQDEKITR